MACQLDTHPNAVEIAGWLRQYMTESAVNQQLRAIDPEHKDISSAVMSRHRTKCLGLVKLGKGRPARSTVSSADVSKVKIEDVTPEQIKNLALRTFYARLRLDPAAVGMKELVSVIGALSRGKEGEQSTKDAVTQAMSNLDD